MESTPNQQEDSQSPRADLLDRSILIGLERIARKDRRAEEDLEAEFVKARPHILGRMLDGHPVAAAVLQFMSETTDWEGQPAELLVLLEQIAEAEKIDIKAKAWPKAAHILTRRLNEVSPIWRTWVSSSPPARTGRGGPFNYVPKAPKAAPTA